MPLLVNLRQLEVQSVRLQGEMAGKDLDLDIRDELVQVNQPLKYDLKVEELEESLLAQGRLSLTLDCECARCLKPFQFRLDLDPWACHIPLQGEEAAPVVNDCVDLTPYLREDILLEFPQHPLCDPECRGLPKKQIGNKKKAGSVGKTDGPSSAWSELNKLQF